MVEKIIFKKGGALGNLRGRQKFMGSLSGSSNIWENPSLHLDVKWNMTKFVFTDLQPHLHVQVLL